MCVKLKLMYLIDVGSMDGLVVCASVLPGEGAQCILSFEKIRV
jgi:hypothetical protein